MKTPRPITANTHQRLGVRFGAVYSCTLFCRWTFCRQISLLRSLTRLFSCIIILHMLRHPFLGGLCLPRFGEFGCQMLHFFEATRNFR